MMTMTPAPSLNRVTPLISRTSAVMTVPVALITSPSRHPFSRSRNQRDTMPACDIVNAVNTPTA